MLGPMVVVLDFVEKRRYFCICEARYGINGLNNLVIYGMTVLLALVKEP